MVISTGNSVGDTATYTCDPGFELIGDMTTTCTQVDMNSAAFQTQELPSCRREYYINVTRVDICHLCGLYWHRFHRVSEHMYEILEA